MNRYNKELSGQSVPLMFGVSAVSMLAITFVPIVLSKGYLRFLSTQLVPGSVPASI
jgi:hypothetical protein